MTRRPGLLDLYQHTDPKLAVALEARMRLAALGPTEAIGCSHGRRRCASSVLALRGVRAYFAEAAGTAARFLAKPDGPRVGAVGFVGWDTHINEGAASGQLANLLGALDGALAAIETNMGDAWRETVVADHHASSDAPRASTAPTEPTTAPAPLPFSPAARCGAGAWSPTGRD